MLEANEQRLQQSREQFRQSLNEQQRNMYMHQNREMKGNKTNSPENGNKQMRTGSPKN
jgi:hypothetical protein